MYVIDGELRRVLLIYGIFDEIGRGGDVARIYGEWCVDEDDLRYEVGRC